MPYIKKELRTKFAPSMDAYFENSGQLNYALTKILHGYIESKGESYQTYNDIIGALECCKLEMYRRQVVPYEDKKIIENGDVY